ncbi:MAG: hypothetical protein AB8G22_23100 [Saprospiraceae bacterium]
MLKIFRKVRQELFASGLTKSRGARVRKYLLYAMGEIILVVIGILIALQFNNQNTRNSTFQKQENHLRLIVGEMKNNLNALREEEENLETLINSQRLLINLMNSDTAMVAVNENDLSGLLLLPMSREISVHYESGALTELLASGGLKDIKNDSIRSVLASWQGRLKGVRGQEKALRESLTETNQFISQHGNFGVIFNDIGFAEDLEVDLNTQGGSNKQVLQSRQFLNILLNYIAVADNLQKRTYRFYERDLEALIDLIDTELKK